MKIRVDVSVFGTAQTYTEESQELASAAPQPVKAGPVRVVLDPKGAAAYERRVSFAGFVDDIAVSPIPGLLEFVRARVSLDFLPSAGAGTYTDANASAVPIDGMPDQVASTPASPWRSVEFLDGRVAMLGNDLTGVAGDVTNYENDGGEESPVTGDGVAYGDSGMEFQTLDAVRQVGFPAELVMIAPGQTFSVATLYQQHLTPLTVLVRQDTSPTPTGPTPTTRATGTPSPSATEPPATPPSPTATGQAPGGMTLYLPDTRDRDAP
jgi:hypothetical protein